MDDDHHHHYEDDTGRWRMIMMINIIMKVIMVEKISSLARMIKELNFLIYKNIYKKTYMMMVMMMMTIVMEHI